jgi:hypothetical protein
MKIRRGLFAPVARMVREGYPTRSVPKPEFVAGGTFGEGSAGR